jgi:hypothetical protein
VYGTRRSSRYATTFWSYVATPKLLEEVEGDLGLPLLDRLADHPEVAPDPERAHLVSHLAQRADDVELRLPGHRQQVGVARVVGRHQVLVHQREHAERLHRTMRWRPLCR